MLRVMLLHAVVPFYCDSQQDNVVTDVLLLSLTGTGLLGVAGASVAAEQGETQQNVTLLVQLVAYAV